MIVKGSGIAPGGTFASNVVNYDFLPTFVDWAGGSASKLKTLMASALRRP